SGRGLGLAPEPLARTLAEPDGLAQELDRHGTVELEILGAVDDGAGPFSQGFFTQVARELSKEVIERRGGGPRRRKRLPLFFEFDDALADALGPLFGRRRMPHRLNYTTPNCCHFSDVRM